MNLYHTIPVTNDLSHRTHQILNFACHYARVPNITYHRGMAISRVSILTLIALCVKSCLAGDDGDDFSNNLFSDLSPYARFHATHYTHT